MSAGHSFAALYVEDGNVIFHGGQRYIVDSTSFNAEGKVVLRCNDDTATLILDQMEQVQIHPKDAQQ